jgi:hypothetical protein
MGRTSVRLLRLTALLGVTALVAAPKANAAAAITIVNADGAGEGFNDATPAAPVGGNTGVTLGQQRLLAAQYAADVWAALLDSAVEIRVELSFDPLACSATGAVLGSTGPNTVHRDFSGTLRPATWYPQALANKLAGFDLSPQDDMGGTFNSTIGTTCALPRSFYYGLDASPPGTDLDFVTIALHELAHGLGFVSFVDLGTGTELTDRDDAFSIALENHSACKLLSGMSDAQRLAAITDTGDLHWVGATVVSASGALTTGVHPSGHVEMYAPDPINPGSSVSHFSNVVSPNELLEPSYTGPNHDVGLALELLLDAGWSGSASALLGGACAGGEFAINTTGQGAQLEPAVAVDGSGGFVVVWHSQGINNVFLPDVPGQDGSGGGIFGRRFDSAGLPIGGEFQINTYTLGVQHLADVTAADNGTSVVVWDHIGGDGGDDAVLGQRFDSDGNRLGGEFQINSYTIGPQGFPHKIAADSTGNFAVVWQSLGQDGSESGVFGQRFDSDGLPLGTEFQVNTFTLHRQGENALALAMADNGDFVVVWKSSMQDSNEFGVGFDGGVFGQRFASDGSRLGGEFQVNTYTPREQGTTVDVAMDADGDFVAVWRSPNDGDPNPGSATYGGVLGQRFDSTGAKVGTEFVVAATIRGLQLDQHVTMDADGDFIVAWADWPNWPPPDVPFFVQHEIDVFGQRFDSTGARVGPQFRVNSYLPQMQRHPDVAAAPNGDFVVAWHSETCEGGATEALCLLSQDGMSKGIFGQRYAIAAPACGPAPRTTCYGSDKSSLSLAGGALKWTWRKGVPLNIGHFANPAAGITHYALCMYLAGAPMNPVLEAAVPAGGTCGSKPCWKANAKGFKYKDSSGAADGITTIKLKAGDEGKSRIIVKGAGSAIAPPLPFTPYTSLTVQLVNSNDECFEALYSAPAGANSATGFKDKF